MDAGGAAPGGLPATTPQQQQQQQQHVQEEPLHEEEREELGKYQALLCSEFASVSGSDLGAARRFLAENGWDVQTALNSYFDSPLPEEGMMEDATTEQPLPVVATETVVDLTDDSASSSTTAAVGLKPHLPREDDSSFSLITWNIDGLDAKNLPERLRGVCSYLALYSPDVVFLQEVIPPTLSYLQKRAVSYTIIPGNTCVSPYPDDYFTAIMIKKSRVNVLKHEITPFPQTIMKRNLLTVHANVSGNELCLMTSHLESTKNFSELRLMQLKLVLAKMTEVPESMTVIFGGDTNLRCKEDDKIGGLPNNVQDIWEFLGKPKHCHYTWDTSKNTNLNVNYKCKMRFDRLFLRAASTGGQILPRSLDLIGLEKLDCGRFPSDHWGLLCNFDVVL